MIRIRILLGVCLCMCSFFVWGDGGNGDFVDQSKIREQALDACLEDLGERVDNYGKGEQAYRRLIQRRTLGQARADKQAVDTCWELVKKLDQRIENHAKILLYEKTQRLVKQMRQINEHYESIGKKPDFL